jgi:hypothetical protein
VGDHQQAAQGLSLLPGASPGVLPHPPRLGAFEKEDEMNDNSEMMKVLETIADRLVFMHLSNNRQFDELKALVAVGAGGQLPLFAVAAAAPASVVPNEDEAMPVVEEATSPTRNVRTRMPADVRALSQGATKLAREGQALIKKAMDGASANSGRMSLEDKKLLDAGTVKMTESKKLQSQYNRERERITYPNGRK